MKKFNVIQYNSRKVESYDILPYFRREWEDKYHLEEKENIKQTKSKDLLKKWIESRSSYMYRARCQYEHLVASWPFGSYRLTQDMKEFLKNNPDLDLDNFAKNIEFENIIIRDMEKIDIYKQIMMNIDIITDILYDEFKLS